MAEPHFLRGSSCRWVQCRSSAALGLTDPLQEASPTLVVHCMEPMRARMASCCCQGRGITVQGVGFAGEQRVAGRATRLRVPECRAEGCFNSLLLAGVKELGLPPFCWKKHGPAVHCGQPQISLSMKTSTDVHSNESTSSRSVGEEGTHCCLLRAPIPAALWGPEGGGAGGAGALPGVCVGWERGRAAGTPPLLGPPPLWHSAGGCCCALLPARPDPKLLCQPSLEARSVAPAFTEGLKALSVACSPVWRLRTFVQSSPNAFLFLAVRGLAAWWMHTQP